MFSHVMVGTNDIEASKAFYDAVLGELGQKLGVLDDKGRCFYFNRTGTFALTAPIDGEPACPANGGTIGFAAESTELVDAWHAYLRDPSGNKICAMYRIPEA